MAFCPSNSRFSHHSISSSSDPSSLSRLSSSVPLVSSLQIHHHQELFVLPKFQPFVAQISSSSSSSSAFSSSSSSTSISTSADSDSTISIVSRSRSDGIFVFDEEYLQTKPLKKEPLQNESLEEGSSPEESFQTDSLKEGSSQKESFRVQSLQEGGYQEENDDEEKRKIFPSIKEAYLSDTRESKTIRVLSNLRPSLGSGRLPINLDLDLYRARCLFRKRENKKAEEILRQCIKDWPMDGKAYVLLGTRLMKQGRFVDARAVLEDGCQAARGENPYIWQAWAILEEKLGHLSEARKLFDAATAADIRHAAAWHGWAVLELRQGNTRKARELLSKGLKYCGGNEYLYQTSALIEYRAGKVELARALFSQAIYYNPNSCASWLAWALSEADQGNNSTARYLFQRGVRASPKNRYVWQAWAIFESNQGNKELARRLFQEGIELNPDDAILLQAYALFEYGSSNPIFARELFRKASLADPKHQPVWNAWGWMEWKEGSLELARKYYKQSLSINSRNMEAARTFHAWAILEEGDGNSAAARLLFKCALRVDSQNIFAWRSWEKLELNLGNNARAEEIRMQYLQQRTEVVDEVPWEVSFSSVFAPAVNRIKQLLGIGESQPMEDDEKEIDLPKEIVEVMNRRKLDMKKVDDDELDIEAFIREVLPWKYKKAEEGSKSFTKTNTKERSRPLIVANVTS